MDAFEQVILNARSAARRFSQSLTRIKHPIFSDLRHPLNPAVRA
jgi:hypothetical protein